MMKSRPPPFAYGIVLFLGAALGPSLLSLNETISTYSDRRSLSNGSLYSLKDAAKYSNLQALEDIDLSVENRALNAGGDRCSRLFLYLPGPFEDHGHGSQINTYITAVITATHLNRALLLVEPPLAESAHAGGSQFGCPVDAFRETVTGTSNLRKEATWEVREDFPRGFSRLVRHPAWLSHGCAIPCADTHGYDDWVRLAKQSTLNEITCSNPDGSESTVVVSTGGPLLRFFRDHDTFMIGGRPSPRATNMAVNLGATPQEANRFSNLRSTHVIWDYVLGLMNKAGFLMFQPWIARDVELFLKSFDLPLEKEYDAIHVRRGDKLVEEARGDVIKFWATQGHTDPENLPTDYVPFAQYLDQWDGPDTCNVDDKGQIQVIKRNVYVATDDPIVVQGEIAELPNHINKNTVLWNDCHQLTFYFNPTDASAFHLNGDGEAGFVNKLDGGGDSCFGRYHRNIASIADMMILSKARTFIGEYNSNWGRVIRSMRVRLNAPVVAQDGEGGVAITRVAQGVGSVTRTLDTRIAWGGKVQRSPGL